MEHPSAEYQIQFLGLGGGGGIFNPKNYVAYFGNFKQWFWAWNRYNTIISGLRVLSNGPTGPIKVLFGIHDICWTNRNWKNGVFSSGLVTRRLYFWRKKDKTDKIPALQKLTDMLKFKVEAESRIFFQGRPVKKLPVHKHKHLTLGSAVTLAILCWVFHSPLLRLSDKKICAM